MADTIFEFRGVDEFHFAEVLSDTVASYTAGTLAPVPVQEIGKTTDSSSDTHYYDNGPMIVITSEGPDTLTLTLAPPAIDLYAEMLGFSYDADTGMMIEGPRADKYFAIAYRTKGTDGAYRYVTKLKGKFSIPDETHHTEDNGTDANNVQITFTAVKTVHKFTKGMKVNGVWKAARVKGIVVDERKGLAALATFFDAIQTPDTIVASGAKAVTAVAVSPTTKSLAVAGTQQLTVTITPNDATDQNVTYYSSNPAVAKVSGSGLITGVAAGTATITVMTVDGGFTATCVVTVS